MIKRIAVLSVLLVYLSVTVGFTMSAHFCGGEVTKVSLSTKNLFCGEKEMEMHCCHNKHVDVKVSDKHQSVNNAINLQTPALALASVPFQPFLTIHSLSIKEQPANYTGPPLLSTVPLTIAYSVFRI
jgi:hypothetical protein